jgi:hypothetical protein
MSLLKKYALIAACTTAVAAFALPSQAATWSITGGSPLGGAFTGYGTAPSNDNVITVGGTPPSLTIDPTNGAALIQGAQLQASFVGTYAVQWVYLGSESDLGVTFTAAAGVAGGYVEDNRNNNCATCVHSVPANQPVVLMGGASGQTALQPAFTFTGGNSVSNGGNTNSGSGLANFTLAYASLIGGQLVLQAAPSDWVIIGFNDSGFNDDNHDDFVLAAFITDRPGETGPTPIPGALPLFASVFGGGLLFLRNRRRKQAAV